jgi:hypothetical protein
MKVSMLLGIGGLLGILGAPLQSADKESDQDASNHRYLGQEPPGTIPKLFAPGVISTGKEHSAAMFAPDGNEMYFGRIMPTGIFRVDFDGESWSDPRLVSFSVGKDGLYPQLTADGNHLYFSSNRALTDGGAQLRRGQYHIWVSERTTDGWGEPVHLDSVINFGNHQSNPHLTDRGELYFSARNTANPANSMDIFRAELIDGKFTDCAVLPEPINTASPEHSPFVPPDGGYMIFSSFRGGYGRSDLFISFRRADDTWTNPVNMGPTINSASKDEYPYVTPDGRYFFLNSNRPSQINAAPIPDGPGNIYWVSASVIEDIRARIVE